MHDIIILKLWYLAVIINKNLENRHMIIHIKKAGLLAWLIIASIGQSIAQDAPQWKLDKSHTSVNFSIDHFFSAVKGRFTEFDGTFYFDPEKPENSRAEFIIRVSSVDTDSKKRDKHLQSDDFFYSEKFPDIKFSSDKIEKKSEKEFLVHGKLTIKGITKKVVLPMKITGLMEHPMMKGTMVLGLLIGTTIDRTDFEVGTGSWSTGAVVGDEVRIEIPMELNKKI